jgi:asparaginyl-tRNA synthetase
MNLSVKELTNKVSEFFGKTIVIEGWIRSNRSQKEFGFLTVNDGSYLLGCQVVYEAKLTNFAEISKMRVGSSVFVEGVVEKSPSAKQPFEIHAQKVVLEGDASEDYPIQPKKHSMEYLREVAHLRPRTNLFQAVYRMRSELAYAIHTYFHEHGYVYFHAPLITASDCEGAGEMFQVTTLDLKRIASSHEVDYSKDFFGRPANLTVSGQLEAESFALAFGKVYTFGPTFRAENSNTTRHASEFWMIEPEIAFADLQEDMNIMEEMIKFVVRYVLEHDSTEIDFFDKFVCPGKKAQLEKLLNSHFAVCTHEQAITLLKESKIKFEHTPEYGEDLATEHEKYLTDTYFNGPVFVTNWPKDIKAFYMRLNDDQKTVAAVDLLVPGSGELCGGSQREERLDLLEARMSELKMDKSVLDWYLDLRRYGGVRHSGFGMGFERLIMYVTGVENIRDVIPFPRTPKNCEY